MARAVAILLVMTAATAGGVDAHGPRGGRGGGALARPHGGHPINAWLGNRRLHLR